LLRFVSVKYDDDDDDDDDVSAIASLM